MKVYKAKPIPRIHYQDEYIGLLDRLLIKSWRERPNFNRRMFEEDFARIFRSSSRRADNLFKVSSSDDELKNRLFENVRTRHTPHSVDDTILKMVEEIAQSLICFGEIYYFLYDDLKKNKTFITPLSAEGIFTLGGISFQFLPKRNETHWDKDDEVLGRELRLLDGKKLMHFRLPKPIKQILSSQNSILASLDKYQYSSMDFIPKVTHENPNPRNNFDFRTWREVQDFALCRATRKTGWNGRKYDSEKRSDFFDCHRMIRFRRNQLVLRDNILVQLSDELTRVGRKYKAGFKIVVSPTNTLPSIKEINELESRLSREEAGFTEVMNFYFKK